MISSVFPGFCGPSAGFDEPFEMLAACHERIEAQLRIVDRMGGHLSAKGADDEARAAARRVLRYFDEAGPKHHADEEIDLFPLLEARGELTGLLQELRQDHRRMEASYASLRPALQAVAEGRPDAWPPDIAANFSALYRSHIACESARLLPAAASLIAAPDKASLGRTMAARREDRGRTT